MLEDRRCSNRSLARGVRRAWRRLDFRLSSSAVLIAAVRSAATYVAVSAYVLIVGPPGMLLAILFRWKSLLYVLATLACGWAWR